jgi:hypothetical protein
MAQIRMLSSICDFESLRPKSVSNRRASIQEYLQISISIRSRKQWKSDRPVCDR